MENILIRILLKIKFKFGEEKCFLETILFNVTARVNFVN